ncbi:hypothetical protein ABZY57_04920 [Streptomyces sp. NPDC006450]|uniref:hypothetical protein n=1 Tax=Streptomyces sp. NPDC006450 TaxID=3155458 RepID=UPI0033A214BD
MTEKVIMSDPAGRPLPDIGNLTLSRLVSDSAVTAAEFRSLIFNPEIPEIPERRAAFSSEISGDSLIFHPVVPEVRASFQSSIGGDECLLPSTNSS